MSDTSASRAVHGAPAGPRAVHNAPSDPRAPAGAPADAAPADAGRVHLRIDGPVATLIFDRPAARNAMTWAMYEQLAAHCRALAADTARVRVVVLRGAGGKAFVAGTDIEQFRAFASGDDGVAYEDKVDGFVAALEGVPQPTIAVVEGWAVGGGMALANACDLRMATPGTRFGVPIARTLGNCLSARNLRRLSVTLGVPLVKRMLLLAETPAAEELPPGYVTVVPAADIDARLAALCERLAGHAPITMAASKELLRRVTLELDLSDEDLVRRVYGSADFREGVEAFTGKRAPAWRGE